MRHGYLKPSDVKTSDGSLKPSQSDYLSFRNQDYGSSNIWDSVKKGGAILLGTLGTLAAVYSFSGCNSVDGSQVEAGNLEKMSIERKENSRGFEVPKGNSEIYGTSKELNKYEMDFNNPGEGSSFIQTYSQK
ncbi:MAG: hypothetical protein ABEI74_01985 [Candidatus Pacearchaeota archaeon]